MKYSNRRFNNFDLLRLVLSIVVLMVHSQSISGSFVLKSLSDFLSGEFAVKCFFVISGFLIFKSFDQSSNVKTYYSKRLRRIYPAYFVIIVLVSLLGGVFTSLSSDQYFSFQWLKYVLFNLLFLNFIQPNLPGLFENNAIDAVNGALWTLKIEVLFYLVVPFIHKIMRVFGYWQIMLTIYCGSLLYRHGIEYWGLKNSFPAYKELIRQLPGQFVFFITGAALYYYYAVFNSYSHWLIIPAIVFLLAKVDIDLIEPIAIGVLVVYFCCVLKPLGNFCKYGDFSYGIYIIHFPVIQLLVQYGLYGIYPILSLFFTLIFVLFLAFVSWHVVEKPFLRHSSHYLQFSHS